MKIVLTIGTQTFDRVNNRMRVNPGWRAAGEWYPAGEHELDLPEPKVKAIETEIATAHAAGDKGYPVKVKRVAK